MRVLLLSLLVLGSPLLQAQVRVSRPAAVPSGPGLRYARTAAEIRQGYAAARQANDLRLRSILAIPVPERSFDNTVRALESARAEFDEAVGPLVLLAYLSPDPDLREAAQAVEVESEAYGIGVWTNEELYRAVSAVASGGASLAGEDKGLLEKTLAAFQSSGMDLPAAKRERLKEVSRRMSVLQSEFARNIQEDDGALELTREELDGLPADYIEGLRRTSDGKYRVGLDYPSYEPFMKHARNPLLRKRLQNKFYGRAAAQNVPILEEALRLRQEAAAIIGYPNYAEMTLSDRMAKTADKVWAFLERLTGMLVERGRQELSALLGLKRQDEPQAQRIESWDLGYYSEKLQRALYDFDDNEVKQYFPADSVVAGTLRVYERLLGLAFTEIQHGGQEAWHPEARLFEIRDAESGRRIGYFYLDLYPRPGKYTHMAVMPVIMGRELEGGYREPVAVMMGNFSRPAGGAPSLLRHDEVETFFHEFGHIMHDTLTKVRYAVHTRVARDFVEAPSQMLENFVWQKEVLDELSGHWRDPSRKLPPELFEKMLKAKKFNAGIGMLRQIALASIDLAYHTFAPGGGSRIYHLFMSSIGLIPTQSDTHPEASFGHIMSGYGAGYYGYLWSQVFAQDIFSRFKREGVLNPAVGRAYRRAILETGGARPEADSLRDFLGREPNEDAFLEELAPEPARPQA